jgi:hypothetical protein
MVALEAIQAQLEQSAAAVVAVQAQSAVMDL